MINKFSHFEDLFLAKLNKNIFLGFYNFFLLVLFSTFLVSSNFGKSWTVEDRKISSFRFLENLINSPLFFPLFCKMKYSAKIYFWLISFEIRPGLSEKLQEFWFSNVICNIPQPIHHFPK